METRTKWLLGGLVFSVFLLFASRTKSGQYALQSAAAAGGKIVNYVKNSEIPVNDATLANRNVQAFLKMIRVGEGTSGPDGYRTLFGGGLFDSYAKHPDVRVPFRNTYSTAAGAYQFLYGTWQDVKRRLNLPDFSPHSQDLGALLRIKERGALLDVMQGNFKDAIAKCNKEWASLPGSPYGQPTVTLADAESNYIKFGGQVA